MSRRPAAPPVGRINTARARMAPGGRMWSEAPILAPRRRVAMAGVPVPGTPPDSVVRFLTAGSGSIGPWDGADITVPAFGVGDTIVALVGTRGDPVGMSITPPAGWTEMASGTVGLMNWSLAIVVDSDGTEGDTWDIGAGGGSWLVGVEYGGFIYSGGSGGTWHHILGPAFSGPVAGGGHYTTVEPDPSWDIWAQFNLLGGIYMGGTAPPGVGVYGGTWIGPYSTPQELTPTVWAEADYTFSTSNPYRPPSSQTFAIGWTP